MDEIARRLGMDPIEIRMKNIFVEGDMSYWGERLHAVGLKETLVKATEAIDYGKKSPNPNPGVKIGKGFACIQKPTRSPTTSAAGVMVNAKGEVTVLAGHRRNRPGL
jgi:carbon-monoxide dehydrogenase large subunit